MALCFTSKAPTALGTFHLCSNCWARCLHASGVVGALKTSYLYACTMAVHTSESSSDMVEIPHLNPYASDLQLTSDVSRWLPAFGQLAGSACS
ncbi:hypothetical protein DPMN_051141 [Dreissena polymorpha]|uniref:Uncharacterized protein n=1 Tax=Dreissena polymorpha TaxID=45954 RepID=A0A9D4HLW4_DREPO|nr:hypothetical protein DPMN_051141 [Dreissena polymorpha]